jgi:hypothetical protein
MDDVELAAAELPEAIRAWLESQPAVILSLEPISADRLLARRLPDIDPALVAHVRVTMAKYREALMNLT